MIESARKHGPFDRRYPVASKVAAPDGRPEETDRGLDWAAFRGRFYPGTSRHDLEAVAAYAAYRSSPAPSAEPLFVGAAT